VAAEDYPYPAGASAEETLTRQQIIWNWRVERLNILRDFARPGAAKLSAPPNAATGAGYRRALSDIQHKRC
jgi:hypothetical protein